MGQHKIPGLGMPRQPAAIRRVSASTCCCTSGSGRAPGFSRSEEHTSELQSLMRISYAVFCLKKKNKSTTKIINRQQMRSEKILCDMQHKTRDERRQHETTTP